VKVFLDTNVLISGIFFPGNEARVLSLPNLELVTSETVVNELKAVAAGKFAALKVEAKRIAFSQIEKALTDIKIVEEKETFEWKEEASHLVEGENDRKILAAVLSCRPDCFLTGDRHFHIPSVKKRVEVKYARELLRELRAI